LSVKVEINKALNSRCYFGYRHGLNIQPRCYFSNSISQLNSV